MKTINQASRSAGEFIVERLLGDIEAAWGDLAVEHQRKGGRCGCGRRRCRVGETALRQVAAVSA